MTLKEIRNGVEWRHPFRFLQDCLVYVSIVAVDPRWVDNFDKLMIVFLSYLRKMSFYAVGVGRQVGVYSTWPECQKQVTNISNARYRKFSSHKEAIAFIQECKEKFSPYKTPSKDSTVKRVLSLSQPSNNSLHEKAYSFSLTQQHQTNRTNQNLSSHAQPSSSFAVANQPSQYNNQSSVQSNDRLSPQTLTAIANLSEDDPFDEELPEEDVSKQNPINSRNDSSITEFMKKVEKYFVDIKSTLGHMMVKIHELDTKVEALTNLSVEKSNQTGNSEAGGRSSVKRNLLANYDDPLPLGRRHISTTANDSEVEVVPVPPKKIPKIELHSDEEVDGFDYDFKVDDNGHVVVYTDGACENNGKRNAKAGIGVWFGDSHPLNCSEPVRGKATNNTAEIQAAVHAIQIAKRAGVKKLLLHTDSEFLINCITKWVRKWQMNGWKVASGNAVKNKEDLILLIDSLEGINVKWEHVRGHSGVHGNEMADRLARSGAERYNA